MELVKWEERVEREDKGRKCQNAKVPKKRKEKEKEKERRDDGRMHRVPMGGGEGVRWGDGRKLPQRFSIEGNKRKTMSGK